MPNQLSQSEIKRLIAEKRVRHNGLVLNSRENLVDPVEVPRVPKRNVSREEKQIQREVAKYLRYQVTPMYPKMWIYATPQADYNNDGKRGADAKALGYMSGTCDLVLTQKRQIPYQDTMNFIERFAHLTPCFTVTSPMSQYPCAQLSGIVLEIKTEKAKVYKKDGTLYANEQLEKEERHMIAMSEVGYIPFFAQGIDRCLEIINWYFGVKH